MKRKSFYFQSVTLITLSFVVLAVLLIPQKRGESLSTGVNQLTYLKEPVLTSQEVFDRLPKDTLLLVNSRDSNSRLAQKQFQQIFKDMRQGYELIDLAEEALPAYLPYQRVVVLIPTLGLMGQDLFSLVDWVQAGGQVLIGTTLSKDEGLTAIEGQLGIVPSSYETGMVESISVNPSFMLGSQVTYPVRVSSRSAWKLNLTEDSKIHAWAGDASQLPLVWEHVHGRGKFVLVNLGIYEKATRGIYAAAYSLLGPAMAYPVINGSAYYIDHFPPPPLYSRSNAAMRSNNMYLGDFYQHIWLPDILDLAEKYDLRYTVGLVESNHSQTDGQIDTQQDRGRFRYFGQSILKTRGEIAYQGYNMQPFGLGGDSYLTYLPEYRPWTSQQAMKSAMAELLRFAEEVFPRADKSVYTPVANVLTPEWRQLLVKNFPSIKSVAGYYFDRPYQEGQEYQIAEDGLIEQPRISSGTIWDDRTQLAAFSELNLHFSLSQYLDLADNMQLKQGEVEDWSKLHQALKQELNWLKETAPNIRQLVGSELAGAVQRYASLGLYQEFQDQALQLRLENFYDQAYLILRLNQGQPESINGGQLIPLTESLYLLRANQADIKITIK